jgi:hypothetical protein
MNYRNSGFLKSAGEILVTLDRATVVLPPGRHTLNSIHSFLEAEALANQRVLGEFLVDGHAVDLSLPLDSLLFLRVDAITVPLTDLPLVLLTTAAQQVSRAQAAVRETFTLVLINDPFIARELWWKIAGQLKEPVLTLSLMPENLCEVWCGTTFHKLRRWQLEQIAMIIRRVDEACDSQDNLQLSDALEKSVLPWLEKLGEHIRLWHEATLAGVRLRLNTSAA